jgi:hypothetical protein
MKIEISNGEILDKISILQIKKERIEDKDKLQNIEKEFYELWPLYEQLVTTDEIAWKYAKLKSVNESLWEIEDQIREYEKNQDFQGRFIELARLVYITNDRRAKIKKEINILTGSNLIEEKSYKEYK